MQPPNVARVPSLYKWQRIATKQKYLIREGYKQMKTQTMQFAVQKKDGVIEKVGRGSILTPKTNFNGKGIKWYEDKPKKGGTNNDR